MFFYGRAEKGKGDLVQMRGVRMMKEKEEGLEQEVGSKVLNTYKTSVTGPYGKRGAVH